MASSSFWETLTRMWGYYLDPGWPFLLLHAFVASTTVWLWLFRIRPDIRALAQWPDQVAENRACIRELEHFREECELLGKQGIAPPMTDLSERLHSRVNVYVDRLHSRVNLFLIVGVAGTFFAMFKFVLEVQGAGVDVVVALRDGLVQAFPIGFYGLLWTIIGHYVAFSWEEQLRNAVNAAIGKALHQRAECLSTVVSNIEEALQPIRELQKTLEETLKPVILVFENQVNQLVQKLDEHLKPVAGVLQQLDRTLAEIRSTIGELKSAVSGFPALIEQMASATKEVRDATRDFASAAGNASGALHRAAGAMIQAASKLETLPETLERELKGCSEQVRQQFEELTQIISNHVQRLIDEYYGEWLRNWAQWLGDFAKRMEIFLENVRQHVQAACKALEEGGNQLRSLATSIEIILKTTLKEAICESYQGLIDLARPDLGRAKQAVIEYYPAILDTLAKAADFSNQVRENIETVKMALEKSSDTLTAVVQRLEELIERLTRVPPATPPPQLLNVLNEVLSEIRRLTAEIQQLRRTTLVGAFQGLVGAVSGVFVNRRTRV